MAEPIVTDPCLSPMLGVGTENELDVRIGTSTPPPVWPAQRGVYKDPRLGLWADPSPTFRADRKTGTTASFRLEPKKTVNFGDVTLDIEPSPVHTLLVSGIFWARMRAERDGNTPDATGQLRPRIAVQAADAMVAGSLDQVIAAGTGLSPQWEAEMTLTWRVLLPPLVRRPVLGKIRCDSTMAAAWTLLDVDRLLTATAVTISPTA